MVGVAADLNCLSFNDLDQKAAGIRAVIWTDRSFDLKGQALLLYYPSSLNLIQV